MDCHCEYPEEEEFNLSDSMAKAAFSAAISEGTQGRKYPEYLGFAKDHLESAIKHAPDDIKVPLLEAQAKLDSDVRGAIRIIQDTQKTYRRKIRNEFLRCASECIKPREERQ